MLSRDEACMSCNKRLHESLFDATFRLPDGTERLCFKILASLCVECSQLQVDPGLIEINGATGGRCVFAIQSDSILVGRAKKSGSP